MNKPFDETGEMRFPDLEAWVLQFLARAKNFSEVRSKNSFQRRVCVF